MWNLRFGGSSRPILAGTDEVIGTPVSSYAGDIYCKYSNQQSPRDFCVYVSCFGQDLEF